MTITRSQAQKAVGEGQDIDYWLEFLKTNVLKKEDMPETAVSLLEGMCPVGGQNFI